MQVVASLMKPMHPTAEDRLLLFTHGTHDGASQLNLARHAMDFSDGSSIAPIGAARTAVGEVQGQKQQGIQGSI